MDRPSQDEKLPSQGGRFNRPIDPAIPSSQSGYTVTVQEWDRLKHRIVGIRSRESFWLSGSSALGSSGIAFGVGVASLQQLEEVAFALLVFFYVATFVGFFGAIICVLGYLESRSSRHRDIDVVLEHMDDIEVIYKEGLRDR